MIAFKVVMGLMLAGLGVVSLYNAAWCVRELRRMNRAIRRWNGGPS